MQTAEDLIRRMIAEGRFAGGVPVWQDTPAPWSDDEEAEDEEDEEEGEE